MSISFSGLASGLDTSSWVDSLVALKRAKIETLKEEKGNILLSKEALNNIKSFFTSFRSMLEKVTDAKFGVASMDLFSLNLANSSKLDVLTASATTEAEAATYEIQVNKLATNTEAISNFGYTTTIIQTTTATNNSKLTDLGVRTGNIGININEIERGIALTENDTIGSFVEKLKNIGVHASFNEQTGIFSMNIDSRDINDIDNTGISDALHLKDVNQGYTSNQLQIQETDTIYNTATESTFMSELGVKDGIVTIKLNDTNYNITIDELSTLGSFIADLQSYNIDAEVDAEGVFTISNAEITNEGTTEILTALGLEYDAYSNTQKTNSLGYSTEVTQVINATEETLISTYDNILIAEGNLCVTVNGVQNTFKITEDETFGTLIDKFRTLGLEATLNDGQLMIQGGYNSFSINTDESTSGLEYTLGLSYSDSLGGYIASESLVQSTISIISEQTKSVANYADNSTKLGLLNISDGSFTVYRDGQKSSIQINSEETFDELRSRLSSAFSDLDLKFEDGYIIFYSKTGNTVGIGATTDTSNFASITGIYNEGTDTVKSARELYKVSNNSIITNNDLFRKGTVTEGTFYVGNATFRITSDTKLSDIISQINTSEEANATAYWDNIDGKFVIKSRTTGSAFINIEAGTSNFTDIMGFTNSEWNEDGSINLSKMKISAQNIGSNAKVYINGTTFTSTSNTLTSDITRIKGVTINLKGLTED